MDSLSILTIYVNIVTERQLILLNHANPQVLGDNHWMENGSDELQLEHLPLLLQYCGWRRPGDASIDQALDYECIIAS